MNTHIHRGSKCFVGLINDEPVAFFAVLHFPHPSSKKIKKGHRLVVLPDYQGIGLGHTLSTAIADRYVRAGFKFHITSSTKSLYEQRRRSKNWIVKRKSRVSYAGHEKRARKNNFPGVTMVEFGSHNKVTFSYEYVLTD